MDKQHYKKVTFDFPAEEYVFLKMACAKQGVSMKDFLTRSVIKSIDDYESELDSKSLSEITDEERKNAKSWDQVKKDLGLDKI